jgi:hypothetical protein
MTMQPRHRRFTAALAFALISSALSMPYAAQSRDTIPARLSSQDFWRLTEDLSEPNGYFRSDNLLSNEMVFQRVLPDLLSKTKPGGVYMGVGPEQNFTYMAAMRPRMAFIVDIRRGNTWTQLMYKALFELSADRAEFVSRLFTKKRPDGLTPKSTASELMGAYWDIPTSDEATYNTNLKALINQLKVKDSLPLPDTDVDGISAVYHAFYWFGPSMTYGASVSSNAAVAARGTTYADLMMQTDAMGQGLSYLATEDNFRFLKGLEEKNLLVPVVGNFGGPKAIRAVGTYVRDHGATVAAFYVSNVEQYLRQDGIWNNFCGNVASLPLDEASVFIRPSGSSIRLVSVTVPPNGAPVTHTTPPTPTVSGGTITSFNGGQFTFTSGQFFQPGGQGTAVPFIQPEVKGCAGSTPGGSPGRR